jgi:acetylornithine/N-succinyldiaminopimelate aminotransferase
MISATGQLKYQKGFEPIPEGFVHVPFGDVEAVKRAISPKTAAIMVEVIQGEGGVRASPPGFIKKLRGLCDEHKLLLLIDEVQTGMGRTGTLFAFEQEDVLPDAISLAKALGNGIPIGAMLCREKHGASLTPGTHGSTFGGNPLAASVANAVWDVISDPALLRSIREKGDYFMSRARQLGERHPGKIAEVRGRGLLIGIETKEDSGAVVGRCREQGLLVNAAGDKTVRFAPPFIITRDELDEGLRLFESALSL